MGNLQIPHKFREGVLAKEHCNICGLMEGNEIHMRDQPAEYDVPQPPFVPMKDAHVTPTTRFSTHPWKAAGIGLDCKVCGLSAVDAIHHFPGAVIPVNEPEDPPVLHFNPARIQEGIRLVLEGLGVDPSDHNFNDTPARVAKCYAELFTPQATGWSVFDEDYTDQVVIREHVFYTLCPHHLLPVKITAAVGYIPNGKVIGASKLIRMIHEVNRYPMTQERITAEIVKSIKKLTQGTSRGEAVLLLGEHDCFRMRGTRSNGSMVTDKFSGEFDTPEKRRQFFDLVKL